MVNHIPPPVLADSCHTTGPEAVIDPTKVTMLEAMYRKLGSFQGKSVACSAIQRRLARP